jgi:hypothetical protein
LILGGEIADLHEGVIDGDDEDLTCILQVLVLDVAGDV